MNNLIVFNAINHIKLIILMVNVIYVLITFLIAYYAIKMMYNLK